MDETLKSQQAYCRAKHLLAIYEIAVYIAFFLLIQVFGVSSGIAQASYRLSENAYIHFLLYIIWVGLLLNIVVFPLEVISSFTTDHRFALSKQNFSSWIKDYFKKVLIGGFLYIIMLLVLYYFLRNSPSFWWLCAALAYFFINVVLAKVFPVLVIPLFYKLRKISEGALKECLLRLAEKAGVKVLDIYNIGLGEKTTKANAAVCGLGSTKRVLLSDTLIANYTQDEIESTLAHELAHHKHQHFWKLSLYNFLFTLGGFVLINIFLQKTVSSGYAEGVSDIKVFPLLAVIYVVYNIIITPLQNFISREYEREADSDAILFTGTPAVFANLINRLSKQNLSDPSPHPLIKIFFYDHPPAGERIASCARLEEKFRKK